MVLVVDELFVKLFAGETTLVSVHGELWQFVADAPVGETADAQRHVDVKEDEAADVQVDESADAQEHVDMQVDETAGVQDHVDVHVDDDEMEVATGASEATFEDGDTVVAASSDDLA